MDAKLEKLTRKVALIAGQKYAQKEWLAPFFYGETDQGKRVIFDPYGLGLIAEEDEFTEAVRNAVSYAAQILFAAYKVERYVFASEAWMLWSGQGITKEEILEIAGGLDEMKDISHHPKRVEVISYQAEDMDGNSISGHQSIIRPAGYQPYLDDDLTLEDSTEWQSTGRFTHLLGFRKHLQENKNANDQ